MLFLAIKLRRKKLRSKVEKKKKMNKKNVRLNSIVFSCALEAFIHCIISFLQHRRQNNKIKNQEDEV